ncbi:unnamed protein product [Penicillium crustosum]
MLPEVLAVCELASSMPVNGAFYWWSGALAPPEWSHCISFVSGWLNIFSMFTATASFAYAVASSLTYAITIILPTMQWTDSQIMAISMGVVIIWAALMSFKLESIITVYICLASSIIYSLSVVAGLITYVIPIFFRIFAGDRWIPGPFNLGRWSIPVHIFTVISQIYIVTMECFPLNRKWTAATMNYNFAVGLAALLLSIILYVFYGRKNYKGLNFEALASWRRHHGVIVE